MKTVLVTGACINTGTDIVKKFAREGYRVLFTGRSPEKVKAAEDAYRAEFPGSSVTGFAMDSLTPDGSVDEQRIKDLFAELDEKSITVDSLVLNAADQGLGQSFFDSPLSDFMKVISTNVAWNYALCLQAALRMKEQGGGSIVFVSSNTAYRAIPDRVAYITSKGGQLGLMRALALDLGKYGIRVNAVLPGMIKTDRWEKNPEFYANVPSRFTPLGDVATGEDIADGVWYLTACARNTTGAELVIDGGNTVQLYPVVK